MAVHRTFVGTECAYVPDLGVWVDPGQDVEFDADPESPLFVTKTETKKNHPEIDIIEDGK